MSYAHLIFGIVLFIVFLVTGQLMRADFPDKEAIEQELRLLMRSRHIYILLSAIIHILLGVYWRKALQNGRRFAQLAGSGLLFAASILLVWAFFAETYVFRHFSELSAFGLFATLGGTVFHIFGGFRLKSKTND